MLALYFFSIILCAHRCLGSPQHVHSYLFSERTLNDNGRIAFTCDRQVSHDIERYKIQWKNIQNSLKNTEGRRSSALYNFGCQIMNGIEVMTCSELDSNPSELSCSDRWGCFFDGTKCDALPNFPDIEVTSTTRLVVSTNEITNIPGYYGIAVYDGKNILDFDILSTEQWNIYNHMKKYKQTDMIKDILSSGHGYVKSEKLQMHAHKMALLIDLEDKVKPKSTNPELLKNKMNARKTIVSEAEGSRLIESDVLKNKLEARKNIVSDAEGRRYIDPEVLENKLDARSSIVSEAEGRRYIVPEVLPEDLSQHGKYSIYGAIQEEPGVTRYNDADSSWEEADADSFMDSEEDELKVESELNINDAETDYNLLPPQEEIEDNLYDDPQSIVVDRFSDNVEYNDAEPLSLKSQMDSYNNYGAEFPDEEIYTEDMDPTYLDNGNPNGGAFLEMGNTSILKVLRPIRRHSKQVAHPVNSNKIKKDRVVVELKETPAQQKVLGKILHFKNGKHTVIEFEHRLWLVAAGHATRLDKSLVHQTN